MEIVEWKSTRKHRSRKMSKNPLLVLPRASAPSGSSIAKAACSVESYRRSRRRARRRHGNWIRGGESGLLHHLTRKRVHLCIPTNSAYMICSIYKGLMGSNLHSNAAGYSECCQRLIWRSTRGETKAVGVDYWMLRSKDAIAAVAVRLQKIQIKT
jgi:hypothetical protein